MGEDKSHGTGKARPATEWVVGGISALLVACLVLYLGRQAMFGDSSPAKLHASIERVTPIGDATSVIVSVSNGGDETAAAVTVLAAGSDAAVTRWIEFDYIPAHAVRRGAFVLPGALEADEIRIGIGGYTEP